MGERKRRDGGEWMKSGEGRRIKDRRWSGKKGRGKDGRGSGKEIKVWDGKGSGEGKG